MSSREEADLEEATNPDDAEDDHDHEHDVEETSFGAGAENAATPGSEEAAASTTVDDAVSTDLAVTAAAATKQIPTGSSAKRGLLELFAGDQADVTLISSFSGAIAYIDASAEASDTESCTDSERIAGWSFFGLVVLIYILRHFWLERKKYSSKPMWFRLMRCFVFAIFMLTLNEQPLVCEVSAVSKSDVRYGQAAIWTGLALFASQILVVPEVSTAVKKSKAKKEARRRARSTAAPTSAEV